MYKSIFAMASAHDYWLAVFTVNLFASILLLMGCFIKSKGKLGPTTSLKPSAYQYTMFEAEFLEFFL